MYIVRMTVSEHEISGPAKVFCKEIPNNRKQRLSDGDRKYLEETGISKDVLENM